LVIAGRHTNPNFAARREIAVRFIPDHPIYPVGGGGPNKVDGPLYQ
jgi:hypothetical protein